MRILNFPGKIFFLLTALGPFCFSETYAASIEFEGYKYKPIEITPENSTGLNAVYIAETVSGLSITYVSDSSTEVEWSVYSNMGGGYAEPLSGIISDGNKSTCVNPKGNIGYIIKDGDRNYNFWLVDYSNYPFGVTEIHPAYEQECDNTSLETTGVADPIYYYTINGRQETLSREIKLHYYSSYWSEEYSSFIEEEFTKVLPSVTGHISITPPVYNSTEFLLTEDRFMEEWGMTKSVRSSLFTPNAVEVMTEAIQTNNSASEDASNQIKPEEGSGMGGSAPCDISFYSQSTEAVIHYEWQIADDENFDYIRYRFNEKDFSYTFNEEGTVYVRFIGSNSDGSCEAYGDTYAVNIGASELLIPNAFSPDDDGINDEWKVSYRSILDFKCWIFDRYGHQITYFDNPEKGWDGKRNGKLVKPGVYYYVIEATGSDGKVYKKSGDINILRHREIRSSSNLDNNL